MINRYKKLHQSPFYKLESKKDLSKLLQCPLNELKELANDYNYKLKDRGTELKSRIIQDPIFKLKTIQRRINELLSRTQTAEYLQSGKKGTSNVKNAIFHKGQDYVLTMDITKFYPSCRKQLVYDFFLYKMNTSPDVAYLLTDLLTYENYLPTGGPCSQLLAYWILVGMFDHINSQMEIRGIQFTLFVDDMTFSCADKKKLVSVENFVRNTLRHSMLKIKNSKTKFYSKHQKKIITGVVVAPNGSLLVPNRIQKLVYDSLIKNNKKIENFNNEDLKSTLGRIRYARQIQPTIFPQLFLKMKTLEKSVHTKNKSRKSEC